MMPDFSCAALDCTRPGQCELLKCCRWNVPFSAGGSMADQPGAEPRSEPKPEGPITKDVVNTSESISPENSPSKPDVGVGDLTSTAKGSGARFNIGKPPMETIPVWIIAEANRSDTPAWYALFHLGEWQRGSGPIYKALRAFRDDAVFAEAAHVFHHVTTRPVKPYPMWNWAKGMPWSVPTACAVRHLLAILRGEENDPETGLPHRGHAMCNLIMLAQYERSYPEGDDRPAFLQSAVA